MKYLNYAFLIVLAVAVFSGCRSQKIIVIDNVERDQTPAVQMKSGFSGETYIWSNWFFSTNRVETLK